MYIFTVLILLLISKYFSSLFKAAEQKTELKEPRKFAELYAKMEKIYFEKSALACTPSKVVELRGRAMLAHVADHSLRTTSSSSILERSFSDTVRSVAARRVTLRIVLK